MINKVCTCSGKLSSSYVCQPYTMHRSVILSNNTYTYTLVHNVSDLDRSGIYNYRVAFSPAYQYHALIMTPH